jgi:SAM-dependent methyltransferase
MTTSSFDPIWEDIFRSQQWGKYPSESVVRFVARHFYGAADRSKVRLLDLGSGPGACTWFMAREGFSVSAIDGSPTAIERLNERLAKEGLKVDAKVGDFVRLPWDDNTFDGVIDNGALCCNSFTACKRVVSEIRRVLRPGGKFSSMTFTDRCWGYGLGTRKEQGGFTNIPEGPLKGCGFVLFMGRAQLDDLFDVFSDVRVERVSWTLDSQAHLVDWWWVTCSKPT